MLRGTALAVSPACILHRRLAESTAIRFVRLKPDTTSATPHRLEVVSGFQLDCETVVASGFSRTVSSIETTCFDERLRRAVGRVHKRDVFGIAPRGIDRQKHQWIAADRVDRVHHALLEEHQLTRTYFRRRDCSHREEGTTR